MMAAELTPEMLVSLIQAVVSGHISRATACALVSPWVEDWTPDDGYVVTVTQTIHGWDQVRVVDGRIGHESHGSSGEPLFSESEVLELAEACILYMEGKGWP